MLKTAMQIFPYKFQLHHITGGVNFFWGLLFDYLRIDISLDSLGIMGYIKYLSLRCSDMSTSSSGISYQLMLIQLEQCSRNLEISA